MVLMDDTDGRVREFVVQFMDESFTGAANFLTEDGRESVVESFPDEFQQGPITVEEALEQYWWGLYGQYGTFEAVDDVRIDGSEAAATLEFEAGTETAYFELGGGEIADFWFEPEYETPDYADESAFEERGVTVDAGDIELDGVLTLPESGGQFPAVLLVHGAGIHDPDGTAGSSKILKDFAWGLASEGIASLRYEKRLNEHEVEPENHTLERVVTDDAIAAIDELEGIEEVAEDAVFVAGHSQGGMAAPQIAERHRNVAGVVILDGPADPVFDPADLDFLPYDIEPDGDLSEEQEAQLEGYREMVRKIADGDYDDTEELLGKPGVWHESTKSCDPAGTASGLDCPVFVLKTIRADEELQPELVEYLRRGYEAWNETPLPDGSRVECYESACHYFQIGPVPLTMEYLYFGGNVAEFVVTDLVEWIDGTAGR